MEDYNIKNPVIACWDIETSLIKYSGFGLWKQNISHHAIEQDWSIICACWKILGKAKVHKVSVLDDPERFKKDSHDDYHVVSKIREMMEGVDILVAHYGDAFDVKKFNARLIYHGLKPLPKLLTIDTKKEASRVASFTSNKLDYLGHILCNEKKMHTDFSLWLESLKGNEKAIKYMTKYCGQDVALLEKVYLKLRPYMKAHPNVANIGSCDCPKCGSSETIRSKNRLLASGIQRVQRQCKTCASYFTEGRPVGSPSSRV